MKLTELIWEAWKLLSAPHIAPLTHFALYPKKKVEISACGLVRSAVPLCASENASVHLSTAWLQRWNKVLRNQNWDEFCTWRGIKISKKSANLTLACIRPSFIPSHPASWRINSGIVFKETLSKCIHRHAHFSLFQYDKYFSTKKSKLIQERRIEGQRF